MAASILNVALCLRVVRVDDVRQKLNFEHLPQVALSSLVVQTMSNIHDFVRRVYASNLIFEPVKPSGPKCILRAPLVAEALLQALLVAFAQGQCPLTDIRSAILFLVFVTPISQPRNLKLDETHLYCYPFVFLVVSGALVMLPAVGNPYMTGDLNGASFIASKEV